MERKDTVGIAGVRRDKKNTVEREGEGGTASEKGCRKRTQGYVLLEAEGFVTGQLLLFL